MNTLSNVVAKSKFGIDASQLTLNDIKAIQKVITARKKELTEPAEIDTAKELRKEFGIDIMNQLLGLNAAFNKINKLRQGDVIVTPDATYSLTEMGLNLDRYNYLTKRFANMIVFFPPKQRVIKPNQLIEKYFKLCNLDDAKFASLQRAGQLARKK